MKTRAELWQWLQDTYHDGLRSNDILLISGDRFLHFMNDFEKIVMKNPSYSYADNLDDFSNNLDDDLDNDPVTSSATSLLASNYTQPVVSSTSSTASSSHDSDADSASTTVETSSEKSGPKSASIVAPGFAQPVMNSTADSGADDNLNSTPDSDADLEDGVGSDSDENAGPEVADKSQEAIDGVGDEPDVTPLKYGDMSDDDDENDDDGDNHIDTRSMVMSGMESAADAMSMKASQEAAAKAAKKAAQETASALASGEIQASAQAAGQGSQDAGQESGAMTESGALDKLLKSANTMSQKSSDGTLFGTENDDENGVSEDEQDSATSLQSSVDGARKVLGNKGDNGSVASTVKNPFTMPATSSKMSSYTSLEDSGDDDDMGSDYDLSGLMGDNNDDEDDF